MKAKVFALVDCNNFYVSCERLFQPKLRNRAVVVLSNLDGCVVSRSNEAKALGIGMAVPVYQVKNIIEKNNVVKNDAFGPFHPLCVAQPDDCGEAIHLQSVTHSVVRDNLVEGSTRDGIGVRNSNDNVVSGNDADRNGRDGIRSRGTSSRNLFEGNHMSGKTEHDAHDENRAANTWAGNHCDIDFPAGTICGR